MNKKTSKWVNWELQAKQGPTSRHGWQHGGSTPSEFLPCSEMSAAGKASPLERKKRHYKK